MKPERFEILSVPVDAIGFEEAVAWAEVLLGTSKPSFIIAINPEKVLAARKDRTLLQFIQKAELLIPDGSGVVWAAHLNKIPIKERVTGVGLMSALCGVATRLKLRVFLLGGNESSNSGAASKLKETYKNIEIVGRQNGYFSESDSDKIFSKICASQADVIFVGMGSPRQEKWMMKYQHELPVRLCQGVGGSFDILSGNVKRAPLFLQRKNLEWAYRLLTTPSRWKRQIKLLRFVYLVLSKRTSGHTVQDSQDHQKKKLG